MSISDGVAVFFTLFARAWASSASNVNFGPPLAAGFCSGLGPPHPFTAGFSGLAPARAEGPCGSSSLRESFGADDVMEGLWLWLWLWLGLTAAPPSVGNCPEFEGDAGCLGFGLPAVTQPDPEPAVPGDGRPALAR